MSALLTRCREARVRAEAATKGPWRWWTSCSYRRLSSDATGKDGDVLRGDIQRHDGHPDVVCSDADRALIAHAREDVPDFATALERVLGPDLEREVWAIVRDNVKGTTSLKGEVTSAIMTAIKKAAEGTP